MKHVSSVVPVVCSVDRFLSVLSQLILYVILAFGDVLMMIVAVGSYLQSTTISLVMSTARVYTNTTGAQHRVHDPV